MNIIPVVMIESQAIRAAKTEAEDTDDGHTVEVEVEVTHMIRMMCRILMDPMDPMDPMDRMIHMTPMGHTARVQRESQGRKNRRSRKSNFVPFELFVRNGKVSIFAICKKTMEEGQDEKIKALQSKIAVLKAVRYKGA